jgi:hypothetical protein
MRPPRDTVIVAHGFAYVFYANFSRRTRYRKVSRLSQCHTPLVVANQGKVGREPLPPLPDYGPTPWRRYLPSWPLCGRREWAARVAAYEAAGECWQEAELRAFLDLCDPALEGPSPINRGVPS